jgi:hypothetical protein
MKFTSRILVTALLMIATLTLAAQPDGWVQYRAKEYGFSMLVPQGTRFTEKESAGGWGELWGEHEGVKLYALAKLGEQATPEEIEAVGVKLTGIPASAWTQINEGENQGGWKWYRTVEAVRNGKLIVGDYGTGPKGSYLIILQTTVSDYEENKADYKTWYQSIRLD